jgi:hypothetical protein
MSPLLSVGSKSMGHPSVDLPNLLTHLPSPLVSQIATIAAAPAPWCQDPLFFDLVVSPVRFHADQISAHLE